jgi:hypothetical protein
LPTLPAFLTVSESVMIVPNNQWTQSAKEPLCTDADMCTEKSLNAAMLITHSGAGWDNHSGGSLSGS